MRMPKLTKLQGAAVSLRQPERLFHMAGSSDEDQGLLSLPAVHNWDEFGFPLL